MEAIIERILANPLLIVCNAVLLAGGLFGYVARRRGWMRRERAATFMNVAIIGFEAPLGLLAVWRLNMEAGAWKLPVAGAALVLAMLLGGFALGRAMRLERLRVPSFAFGASMSNIGYTLAGFVALWLLGPDGLGYQYIYVIFWVFFVFLVAFPIGHHYASTERLHPLRLVRRSLTDIRSLPLYAVTAGIVLNRAGVPCPAAALDRIRLGEALLLGGIACSYVAIGLSVVFSAMRPYLRQSAIMCALKFGVTPALMLALAAALGLTGIGRQLCILQSFMPCAVYSVMLATLFGADRDLAVTNFLLTHAVFFAVILPFVLPWAIYL